MSGAQSISARRAYGVQRVCRVWGRARSSVYVRRHATRSRASRRRGPVGAATDEVLVGHIRRVLEASPFHGEGYRKAWAKRSRGSAPRRNSFTLPEGLREWYYDTLEQRGCTSTELCRAALRFKREGELRASARR